MSEKVFSIMSDYAGNEEHLQQQLNISVLISMDEVARKAVRDLRIGDLSLGSDIIITEQKTDLQTLYRRPDKDYLAEMCPPGVLYSLYMMSCGSFPIKYDSSRDL